jgi:hypothetical protein
MQKGETMNTTSSLAKRLLITAGATLALISVPVPVSAAAQTSNVNCVITVIGIDENGTFETEPMRCYSTFGESLRSIGAKVSVDATPQSINIKAVAAASGVIGVHYDASNGTGASLTVNGSNCIGGGLNVPLSWNDRISSTLNGCPTVQHFENTNYAGASFSSYGVGSITSMSGAYMDNRTSAIKYY